MIAEEEEDSGPAGPSVSENMSEMSVDDKSESDDSKKEIIENLINTQNVIFKSEQLGETDTLNSEKRDIAIKLLDNNPGKFLANFGKYLSKDNLKYFEKFRSTNYEVEFYLNQLNRIKGSVKSAKTIIKNRRYEALKKLADEGEYFSENEMKRRNPLLYEQLIGQYLTEEEQNEIESLDTKNMTLITLLMDHMDRDEVHSSRLKQQMEEDCQMEESDDDSEEDDIQTNAPAPVNDDEKLILRNEFISLMYKNFLEGKDKEFDYTSVDENTEYDNIEIQTQDAEDNYFDSETPEESHMSEADDKSNKITEEDDDDLDAFMSSLPPTVKQVDSSQPIGYFCRK